MDNLAIICRLAARKQGIDADELASVLGCGRNVASKSLTRRAKQGWLAANQRPSVRGRACLVYRYVGIPREREAPPVPDEPSVVVPCDCCRRPLRWTAAQLRKALHLLAEGYPAHCDCHRHHMETCSPSRDSLWWHPRRIERALSRLGPLTETDRAELREYTRQRRAS
jgi:hypothetical protein